MADCTPTRDAYRVPQNCHHGDSLPLTGFDVAALVAVALLVIALGVLMRRTCGTEDETDG